MSRSMPVSIRLDEETKKRVHLLADEMGCAPHAVMRAAIEDYLERKSQCEARNIEKETV